MSTNSEVWILSFYCGSKMLWEAFYKTKEAAIEAAKVDLSPYIDPKVWTKNVSIDGTQLYRATFPLNGEFAELRVAPLGD